MHQVQLPWNRAVEIELLFCPSSSVFQLAASSTHRLDKQVRISLEKFNSFVVFIVVKYYLESTHLQHLFNLKLKKFTTYNPYI